MSVLNERTPLNTKIDPTGFDVTISAILISLGADKYIDIFKKHNIGQSTLAELTDEDLIKLEVDDPHIRKKLLEAVKDLPIYQETKQLSSSKLGPLDLIDMFAESSEHLFKIYLSVMGSALALKKNKKVSDCLIHQDKYASDVALITLSEINNILNSMDIALHTQNKDLLPEKKHVKKKKIIVGTVGSAVVAILAVLFVRSLKQLK